MVKQGPLLLWKIETWLPNCEVIYYGKVDNLSQLQVFFPLTSDVHMYQILPQRLPGWKTGRQRAGDIRMNWPIVMSYNLLHELICGSLSTESRRLNVSEDWSPWERVERRVLEMRCMVEFNCTSTNPV